jgi:hypothetical protein
MQDHKTAISELLKLCIAQLKMSQDESEKPVDILTQNFIQLTDLTSQLLKQNKTLGDSQIDHRLIEQLEQKVKTSVMAFQFHDRLTQRLCHVIEHLNTVEDMLRQESLKEIDIAKVLNEIKSSYSMEQERKVFDAILKGESVEQALQKAKLNSESDEQGIELF